MATKTGLLTAVHLANIANTLAATRKYALGTLYVQLHPRFQDVAKVTSFSKFIASVYQSSPTVLGPGVDLRILISSLKLKDFVCMNRHIDYVFYDYCVDSHRDGMDIAKLYPDSQEIELGTQPFSIDVTALSDSSETFKNVVLGGTFDRMHAGHKVLLSQAALLATERLVIGVTDENMIKNKKLWELIHPTEWRIEDVRAFLEDIDSTLKHEVVPISDPFGPTATDPDMDLIVVSTETSRGGAKVNELRAKNGLKQLQVHTIELLDDELTDDDKEDKISSSNQRMDLLGTRLKPRVVKPHLSPKPYIIGLVGGVAAGKSKMAERFAKLGAGVIDCDKIAHELYEPGEDCYQAVVNNFGVDILNKDKTINRKALGEIVFSDKDKLDLLNTILWDAILDRTKLRIKDLYEKQNKQIIIMEAAVLLRAGWQSACHEVWSCIIPREDAIKRLKERNSLTEEEAEKRVNAQVSNSELVKHSDVVFCTAWSYEYSQTQAEKAWANLMEELKLKL